MQDVIIIIRVNGEILLLVVHGLIENLIVVVLLLATQISLHVRMLVKLLLVNGGLLRLTLRELVKVEHHKHVLLCV